MHSSSLLRDFADVMQAIDKISEECSKEEERRGEGEGEGEGEEGVEIEVGGGGVGVGEGGRVEVLQLAFEEKKDEWREIAHAQILSLEILTNIFSGEGEEEEREREERERERERDGWSVSLLRPYLKTVMEGVCVYLDVSGYPEFLLAHGISPLLNEIKSRYVGQSSLPLLPSSSFHLSLTSSQRLPLPL